jgi:hypothetical protein
MVGRESVSFSSVAALCGGDGHGDVLIQFSPIHVKACGVNVYGVTKGIGHESNVFRIYMYNSSGSTLLAYPTKLSSQKVFILCWKASS